MINSFCFGKYFISGGGSALWQPPAHAHDTCPWAPQHRSLFLIFLLCFSKVFYSPISPHRYPNETRFLWPAPDPSAFTQSDAASPSANMNGAFSAASLQPCSRYSNLRPRPMARAPLRPSSPALQEGAGDGGCHRCCKDLLPLSVPFDVTPPTQKSPPPLQKGGPQQYTAVA
jgi:hypothetical protein